MLYEVKGNKGNQFTSRIEDSVKKVPAMQAVIRQAKVAAKSARSATDAMLWVFCGARAEIPPTKIATEARWAKPHKA